MPNSRWCTSLSLSLSLRSLLKIYDLRYLSTIDVLSSSFRMLKVKRLFRLRDSEKSMDREVLTNQSFVP